MTAGKPNISIQRSFRSLESKLLVGRASENKPGIISANAIWIPTKAPVRPETHVGLTSFRNSGGIAVEKPPIAPARSLETPNVQVLGITLKQCTAIPTSEVAISVFLLPNLSVHFPANIQEVIAPRGNAAVNIVVYRLLLLFQCSIPAIWSIEPLKAPTL